MSHSDDMAPAGTAELGSSSRPLTLPAECPPRQPIALQHRTEILTRVALGERLHDIALSLGYASHAGISRILADDPEYREARETGLEARMDTREAELEAASESVTVARARELLSHARWRAERECPHRWGQRSHVTVEHADLGDRLRRARERVIEGVSEPVVAVQAPK